MSQFKEIRPIDVSTSLFSSIQQVVFTKNVLSGTITRRKYQTFTTGGIGPGVTSSLFQTIHDADWNLVTSNPLFDMTVGLFTGSATVLSATLDFDSVGNNIFSSQTLMMQEKMDIYRQFAQNLLGDSRKQFVAPFSSTSEADLIDEAIFLCIKRPFSRDGMIGDTFAMQIFPTGTVVGGRSPINLPADTATVTYLSDIGSDSTWLFGGESGNIYSGLSSKTTAAGLAFYNQGMLVLDAKKVLFANQMITGSIDALNAMGQSTIGGVYGANPTATIIPDLFLSASIDDIVDHIAGTRFPTLPSSDSPAAVAYQNKTNVNSTVVTCRATADEFNFSSNPTFTDPTGKIVVIEDPLSDQRTFSFITSVGLYDANDNLLAVAKLSKPFYKDDTVDVTFNVRLNM